VQAYLTSSSAAVITSMASVDSVHLTSGSNTLTLSVAQLTNAFTAVTNIESAGSALVISDSAAHVQADLATGVSSEILNAVTAFGTNSTTTTLSITLPGSSTITLTEAQLTYAGVDDSATAAVAVMSGLSNLVVTGVTLGAELTAVLALHVMPTNIKITDSIANIVADINGSPV
jgi:hypothetical protein